MHVANSKVSGRGELTAWRSTVASVGGWRLPDQAGSIPSSMRLGPSEGGLRARAGPGCGGSATLQGLWQASVSGLQLPPLGWVMLGAGLDQILDFIVEVQNVYIGKTSVYVYVAGLDPLPSSI